MINPIYPAFYMKHALALAEHGRFTVSPNPMVGCLIVKHQQIVGSGFHQKAGEPHAEIFALKEAGENAKDADMYVTLEPCCHQGKTPPCTNVLIQAGIKRVFIACLDPNPLVAGKGVELLNKAGIETFVGILEDEAKTLNKVFFHYITHKRPFVIAKWAMSLDGKTITHPNDSRVISDSHCHEHAHEIRHAVDAILIGSKTALLDNPKLTSRYDSPSPALRAPSPTRGEGKESEVGASSPAGRGKQPTRIILASHGNLPLALNLFSDNLPGKTIIVVTESANQDWIEKIKMKSAKNQENTIELWTLPSCSSNKHHINIPSLLNKLGEHQITSLLVEGGEQVRNSFFSEENQQYINEIHTYISPVFIGDLEKKIALSAFEQKQLGDSLCLVASLKP